MLTLGRCSLRANHLEGLTGKVTHVAPFEIIKGDDTINRWNQEPAAVQTVLPILDRVMLAPTTPIHRRKTLNVSSDKYDPLDFGRQLRSPHFDERICAHTHGTYRHPHREATGNSGLAGLSQSVVDLPAFSPQLLEETT